jgi:formylglycine-generating enzyme required for sulfatase activity
MHAVMKTIPGIWVAAVAMLALVAGCGKQAATAAGHAGTNAFVTMGDMVLIPSGSFAMGNCNGPVSLRLSKRIDYVDGGQTNAYRSDPLDQTGGALDNTEQQLRELVSKRVSSAHRGGVGESSTGWCCRPPVSMGDSISHKQANYKGMADYRYDISETQGCHPSFATGGEPHTSPVGSFDPNGYGLYDMAGNIWEWCWDRHAKSYFFGFRCVRGR